MTEKDRQLLMDDLFARSTAVYLSANQAYEAGDIAELSRLNRLHRAISEEYHEVKRREHIDAQGTTGDC